MRGASPDFLSALAGIVGERRISTTPPDRAAYARDLWPRSQLERLADSPWPGPAAVAWPGSADEAAAIVRICADAGVPIVPFGAGSGVCGGARAVPQGIVVDLKRLKRVRSIDRAALRVEVEAGLIGMTFEEGLERQGLTLGHFPSSILCSTVGGWIAGRSAGQCSSRYGKIEDMVVDLEVVTGDGVVRRTAEAGGGLDWNQIFIGSEGTLGLITAATLKVHPQPEHRRFRGWRMPSVAAGLEMMRATMQAGLRPAVMRMYDPIDTLLVGNKDDSKSTGHLGRLKAILSGSEGASWLERRAIKAALGAPSLLNRAIRAVPDMALLVTVAEGTEAEAAATDAAMADFARRADGRDLGEQPGRAWLAHRYDVSYKQSKMYRSGTFVDTFEVATTWGRVESLYEAVRRAVADEVLVMAHFSHVYPGGCSVYFTFAGTGSSPEAMRERYDRAWQAGLDATVAHGGVIAHHHGSGLSRRRHMDITHGEGRRYFDALKAALDPAGIFNPGKLFPEGSA